MKKYFLLSRLRLSNGILFFAGYTLFIYLLIRLVMNS